MIEVQRLLKRFGDRTVLEELSLRVPRGTAYGLVGSAGAGKTTLLNILAGLEVWDAGSVHIAVSGPEVGYVPGIPGSFPAMTVGEYMDFFAACCGLSGAEVQNRIHLLLEMAGLSGREAQLTDSLSPGQRRKLSLVRALLPTPSLLLLDEPMKGMDSAFRSTLRQILSELSAEGTTLFMTASVLSDVSGICSDIGILDGGRLVLEGSLGEVQRRVNASSPIIITVEGAITEAIRILKENPGVHALSIRNRELLIHFEGDAAEEAGLLEDLVMAGVPVCGFHREQGNLEALFRSLSGEETERRISGYEAESDL